MPSDTLIAVLEPEGKADGKVRILEFGRIEKLLIYCGIDRRTKEKYCGVNHRVHSAPFTLGMVKPFDVHWTQSNF
jgi:hypothetical protein